MANFIQELVCKGPLEEVRHLKNKVKRLEQQLADKQEHINKTNAFYKKKMREIKASSK